ncbi:Mgm101p-domain-containing protein [Aspergillus indologenus CBS 114.80]|uniref:Mitochondrial genome maintenance protein MGM101 n=1 Tax=Aspergillus indologenus CBS 114.80 TaxID=1450541 RepID=A0A2V5IAQ8_9EURO|nr:Mgm101p-domain-containing protein [Aspergillus indologenus CBS 114.80]
MSLPTLARTLRITASTKPTAINLTLTRTLTTTRHHQATQPSAARARPNHSTSNNSNNSNSNTTKPTSPSPNNTTTQQPQPNHPPKITANLTTSGLRDQPQSPLPTPTDTPQKQEDRIDWTRSFHGLSAEPFPKEAADILLAPTDPEEVEIKPDGILYLPEIKYRRILNRAFGPGGWGLVPRSESIVTPKMVTREYALVCHGRLVSVARGEQDYFSPDGIPTATEGCRSNALVRCCKDLGIASELWDPRWIRKYKAQYTREAFVEHVVNKRKSKIWVRKDDEVSYPWKETK